MSAQVNTVFTGKDESLSRTLKNIEGSASRVDKVLGTLKGRIRTAFEFHVINRGIALFERGIHRVLGILPDLINRGEAWARTVDRIVDITGMSAAQASELAAVAENVGVNSDGLGRMMNALARSVATNADEFRAYGIRVKDANGHLLDGYTIFQNVRQRIAEMGPSLQAAKLSQMAFGRAALESADMLTLSNREWQRQIELARQSGLIMTEAGLAAAEEWERTQGRLQQAITGIGAQILQGVAPALIGLTNGVTRVINANMDGIVRFAAGLVNFLANLAADLLGIQIDTTTLIGNAYDDAAKKSEKLRQRVDDMSNANQRSAASNRANAAATDSARKQQQRLREELERAQRQLSRERRATTFTGGMNGVELELWKQQKAASVKAAQERVADARKALSDHRATMGKMTGVTAAAARQMRLDLQSTFGGGGAKGTIIEGLDQTLRDSKTFALGISDAIKDAIFGEDVRTNITGGAYVEVRSGGLLDAMSKVATFLGTVGGHLSNLNTLLGGAGGLIAAVLGLGAVIRLIPGVPSIGTGASVVGTLAKSPFGPMGIAAALNAFLRQPGPKQPDEYGVFGNLGMTGYDAAMAAAGPRVAAVREAVKRSVEAYLRTIFNGQASTPRGLGGGLKSGGGFDGFTPDWDLINSVMPGFGFNGASTAGITALAAALDRSRMGRALESSGAVPLALGDISSGIFALQTLIDERLPSGTEPPPPNGGDNLATRVDKLAARMVTAETVNKVQTKRIDKDVKALAAFTSAQKTLWAVDARSDKAQNAKIAAGKAVNAVQAVVLTGHEKRIKALENGGDSRNATATRKTSDNTERMVNILLRIEKNTRTGGGGGRTSSLRPAV